MPSLWALPGRSLRPLALAASLLLAGPLSHAASFSALYVMGDSLSDMGNAARVAGVNAGQIVGDDSYVPDLPYASGTLSNGPVWADYLSKSLGLGPSVAWLGGGTNYAFGGANTSGGTSPSLIQQAAWLVADAKGKPLPANALYVVAGGGNNGLDALDAIAGGANVEDTVFTTASSYANDIGTIVDGLQAAGARHILVWNTPNLGLTPAVRASAPGAPLLASFLSQQMNEALSDRLAGEEGVLTFDVYGLLTGVVASGTSTFSNVTRACGSPVAGCNPSTALFWDGIHPTTYGHQFLAGSVAAAVAAIPEPGTYALMLGGLALVGCVSRRSRTRM